MIKRGRGGCRVVGKEGPRLLPFLTRQPEPSALVLNEPMLKAVAGDADPASEEGEPRHRLKI